jgi:hemolysin III
MCRAYDQMAIYALISGTYTPLCLVTLRPEYPVLSWTVFIIIWSLTVAGIVFKLLSKGDMKYLTTFTYLAMGWFGLVLIMPLWGIFSPAGIMWIVLGGVMYSIGVGFYLLRILPFNHTVWHLFVLAGTICHFFAILFYVMMV